MGGLGDLLEEYRRLADLCGFLSVTGCDLTAERCWEKSPSPFFSSSSEDSSDLSAELFPLGVYLACATSVQLMHTASPTR